MRAARRAIAGIKSDMGDAFDVLGIAVGFRAESRDVERAYVARAVEAHPDLVGSDDESARRMAELNEAKGTLLDPERRAIALLARLGGAPAEADRSLPDGFLMEMMDVRERMEEEWGSGDAPSRSASAQRWEAWGRVRREETMSRVAELFDAAARASEGERQSVLGAIRTQLNAWRYLERMLEQTRMPGPM